jgi:hypothetical protein
MITGLFRADDVVEFQQGVALDFFKRAEQIGFVHIELSGQSRQRKFLPVILSDEPFRRVRQFDARAFPDFLVGPASAAGLITFIQRFLQGIEDDDPFRPQRSLSAGWTADFLASLQSVIELAVVCFIVILDRQPLFFCQNDASLYE